MARSRRQSRRFSRSLTALLMGGCGVFAGYYFWPTGDAQVAEASEPAVSGPLAKAANPVAASLTGPAKPLLTTATGTDQTLARPVQPLETHATTAPSTRPVEPAAEQASATLGSAAYLDQAKALQNEGQLLEARAVLNEVLCSQALSGTAEEEVKKRIRDLNQTIVFTPSRRYKDDPQQSEYTVQTGDSLAKICRDIDVPYEFIARINAVKPNRIRVGQSLKIVQGPIHAVVSKKNFTIDLYLGGLPGQPGAVYLESYPVGLGEDSSTPTGTWEVTRSSKTVNPAWTNPRTNEVYGRDDPKNPLGERWIGLTGIAGDAVGAVSYGIHGTIEPDSIGTNASMGCIRLRDEAIAAVFDMLSEGKSTVLVIPN